MPQRPADYSRYVRHPRFGQAPRLTGLDPDPDAPDVHLHWNTRFYTSRQLREMKRLLGWVPEVPRDGSRMVARTAIAANLSKQTPATVPVTHYYDIDKTCRDCGLRFIFFAEEQQYWYEDLGFPLEADAVRCQPCRRRLQSIAKLRKRYEQLIHLPSRTIEETMEMADSCLMLVEERIFHSRQVEHVRALLNQVPESCRLTSEYRTLASRADAVVRRRR